MSPSVSINLCCYNSERYLRETLDSVVNQTCKDWELVIINDGSTDTTEAILKEYIAQGFPIVYFSQENHGLGYSRNEALKRSSGKYISFIDHDDIWMPRKLEQQLAILENFPRVDFVYTNYYKTGKRESVIKFKTKQPEGHVFDSFLAYYPVHLSTVMVRAKAFDRVTSFFDPNLNLAEEYDLFMRILYNGEARYLSEPLATYRHHPEMGSAKKAVRLAQEVISVIGSFNKLDPDFDAKHAGILKSIIPLHNRALAFESAKEALTRGDSSVACEYIKPYRFSSIKIFIFFVFTCFPSGLAKRLWFFFHGIQNICKN